MRGFLLIATMIVLGYVSICTVLYIYQERLIFFPERLPDTHTFSFALPFEELHWKVDGATINALHFKAERPKGAILYLHGNGGSLRGWGGIADMFVERGYDVLIPDYRGYGKSTGTLAGEETLHTDALVAYTYLRQHFPEERIILYGRSLGSGIAARLAAEQSPSMLILETPYVSLKEIARRQFPFAPAFLLRYPLHTDRWITKVRCPVYLFHGTHDELIPYSSSERLLPLIPTPHELFTIPGGGHNNLGSFPQYRAGLERILR
jgi:hypothetical protein